MRDRSIYVIIAVVVLAAVAASTGFREVPLSENPWMSVRFGSGEPSRPGVPSRPGSPRATERTVEAGGATSAKVRIEQALGEMTIEGGSDSLMDATFDTRPSGWIPEVSYSVEGTVGTLVVAQPEDSDGPLHDARNTWNLALSKSLPIDLTVKRGVGEGTLDLRGNDIVSLRALLGLGETMIDLSGERTHDVDVRIESGVGECRLVVPDDMAVRVYAEKGLGEVKAEGLTEQGDVFVSAKTTGPMMTVHITQGIGAVVIETAP